MPYAESVQPRERSTGWAGPTWKQMVSLTGCRVFAVLLRTYVDDSSDEKQEQVVVAGAFVGWYHQWNALQLAWKRRLKREPIDYFRSTEYYSLRGQFERYRDPVKYPKPKGSEAATKLRSDLDQIIHDSQVMGIAATVPMEIYNEFRATEPDAKELLPDDPYELALQALFDMCARTVLYDMQKDRGRPHRLAFICDDSSAAPRITKMFSEFRQKNQAYAEVIESLVHRDDKKRPELQAADLMAHLAKERMTEWLKDPAIFTDTEKLKTRLKHLGVYAIGTCNKEWLLDILQNERKVREANLQ